MPAPWPALALTVIGLVGMFSALRPWLEEVHPILQMPDDEKVPWSIRRRLLPWALLVAVFGLVAIIGLILIAAYLIKHAT